MKAASRLAAMCLRITTRRSGQVTVVQIYGQLRKDGVPELQRACESIEGPLCLDLANLQSIDAEGARSIVMLQEHGAAVAGVSPYIDLRLKRATH